MLIDWVYNTWLIVHFGDCTEINGWGVARNL
jgi:hypothetical protein